MGDFVNDIQGIRQRAREHMDRGPVTSDYGADVRRVIEILNEVLATEIVCTLRYKRHYYTIKGIHTESIAQEFLEHANEEQQHADRVAERISQLRGEPDFNPETLTRRSHAEYQSSTQIIDMLQEDLVAERVAIETYREIVRWLGNSDPTTRRLMEDLLAKEEEHADELATLLEGIKTAK